MKIKAIENEKDFFALKIDWNKLAGISPNNFNWIYKWWWYYKKNNELKILIAEKDSKIVGIAPLYIHNENILKFIRYKKLMFLGGLVTDNLDFLIEKDINKEIVFKAFWDYILCNFKFDLFEFSKIYSTSEHFELWNKYSRIYKFNFQEIMYNRKIDMTKFNSYEEYYNSLDINLKRNLGFAINKIKNENLKVQFEFHKTITDNDFKAITSINGKKQQYLYSIDTQLKNKFRFVKKQFKVGTIEAFLDSIHYDREDFSGYFYYDDERSKNFLKEYFCMDNSDSSTLVYMKLNDKVIAYALLLSSDASLYCHNSEYLPEYGYFFSHKLMLNELIKYAFDNKYEYFDFMAGNERYKTQWSNRTFKIYKLVKNQSLKSKIFSLF